MNYTHGVMSPKLEVRHLKLLVTVAEEGSVTEAGKRLHLTQSALSHQLRDAEEKLGTALFLRLGRKMVLTPAGERLIACARRVLDELSDTEVQIEGLNGGARGEIRLSTECYTCYHWLPPVLQKFHGKFSKVEVNIVASATSDPGGRAAGRQTGRRHHQLSAAQQEPASHAHVRRRTGSGDVARSTASQLPAQVRPKDLETETVLIYPPREESTLINKLLKPAGVEAQRVIEVPLTEAIVELAAAGTGIGFLARWAVAPAVEAGKVAIRPLGGRGFRRQWYAVTLRNQPTPPFLAEFLNLLSNVCPKNARRMSA